MNNVLAPANFTTILVGDANSGPQAPFDVTLTWPKVNVGGVNYPASGCAAFVSASGGIIMPRLTQAQVDALPLPGQQLISGTQLFNTTTNSLAIYDGASFQPVGAAAVILKAVVVMTAAQVVSMGVSPFTIVPAAGAGMAIFPSKVILNFNYKGTSFTTNPGGLVSIRAGAAQQLTTLTSDLLNQGASSVTYTANLGSSLTNLTTFNNQPITIFNNNTITGGGTSTLTVQLEYSLMAVS